LKIIDIGGSIPAECREFKREPKKRAMEYNLADYITKFLNCYKK